MKKFIVLSLCILAFTFAKSQDLIDSEEISNDFKQNSGDKNLELQFDPGAIFNASNGNNVFSNGVGIRFRLFPSESLAYRLNLNINYTNSTTVTQDAGTNILELKDKNSEIGAFLKPGIEKHFLGTKRLSPYIGAEAIIGYNTSTQKSEYEVGTDVYEDKFKNANVDDGITVGIAAVAGADFYIAKKLYLGLELNYGLYYFMASAVKYSTTEPNIDDIESKLGNTNTLSFSPGAMGVFRIGFLF